MKEQQATGVYQDSNLSAYAVSPTKYHPSTASFIIFLKRAISNRCVFTELLVTLITGWI